MTDRQAGSKAGKLVWLLVEQDGAVLLGRRRDDEAGSSGRWSLPGGEIDAAESVEGAARRLASEQLGVEIMGVEYFESLQMEDKDRQRLVDVLRVGYEGRPRYRESGPYAEVGWVGLTELKELDLDMPPELNSLLERLAR